MLKFGQNPLIKRLLASAVDALITKSNLELIQKSWEQLLLAYESLDITELATVDVAATSIPKILTDILDLIKKDEGTFSPHAPDLSCLDYFIQERALIILVDYALEDAPRGLRLEVARFFATLVARHPGRILPHLSVRRPLLRLVQCLLSALQDNTLAIEVHIDLLVSIITSLSQNLDLLGLFTTSPTVSAKGPTSQSEPIILELAHTVVKLDPHAPIQILLTSLLIYSDDLGPTGVRARGALLELIHILCSDSSNLMLTDPTFMNILLGQLKELFNAMPINFSLRERLKRQPFDFPTSSLSSDALARIGRFFELWRFANELLSIASKLCSRVFRCLLDFVVVPFIDDVHEKLNRSSTSALCSRILYYLEMLQASRSHDAYVVALSLLLNENHPALLTSLIQKINAENDEVSLICLQTFDTLLSQRQPSIYRALLPGFFSAHHNGPLRHELLANKLLALLKPVKFDLRSDLKEFLQLLNPPLYGHEQYCLECLSPLEIEDFNWLTFCPQASPQGEVQLPLLLQVLVDELQVLSRRSPEKILLITGIMLKLMKLPFSRLMFDDWTLPRQSFIDCLIDWLQKGLAELEVAIEDLGQEVWDLKAIGTSAVTSNSTGASPSKSHCYPINLPLSISAVECGSSTQPSPSISMAGSQKPFASPSKLDGLESVNPRLSSSLETLMVAHSPSESLLMYVSEAHRSLFMSYVALQEFCKELAAFLTVFHFNATTGSEIP